MTPAECAKVLRRGFGPADLQWKVQTCGKNDRGIWARIVPYVDARAVIARLDEAFGPLGYSITYEPIAVGPHAGMKCQILARVTDESGGQSLVLREDVSEVSDIEALKGAASGALKRAFVQFGGSAYLYESPDFYAVVGPMTSQLPFRGRTKPEDGKEAFKWGLPAEAYEWMAATIGSPISVPAGAGASSATTSTPGASSAAAPASRGTSGSPAPSPVAATTPPSTPSSTSVLMPGKEGHFKNWATRPIIDVPNDVLKEAFDYLTVKSASPTNKFKKFTDADLAIVQAEMDRRRDGVSDDGDPGPEQPEGLDEEWDDEAPLPF
jgi:hypothetical protein